MPLASMRFRPAVLRPWAHRAAGLAFRRLAGSSSDAPIIRRHTAAMPSCAEATTTVLAPARRFLATGVSTVSAALAASWP